MELDTKAIGRRIAQRRIELGLTQRQLSELLHISDRHMSSIETGKSPSSLSVITDISRLLDTTLDYLILGTSKSDVELLSNQLYQKILDFSQEQIDLLELFIKALESK